MIGNYQWHDIKRDSLHNAVHKNKACKLINNSNNMTVIISYYGGYDISPVSDPRYTYFVSKQRLYRVTYYQLDELPMVCQSFILPDELFGKITIYPKRIKR